MTSGRQRDPREGDFGPIGDAYRDGFQAGYRKGYHDISAAAPAASPVVARDHLHDPFDLIRWREWLSGFGHRPTDDGRCEHRWRNRITRAVKCPFLDGFRFGLVAPAASPVVNLDVERLARALRAIGQPDLIENARWGYDALAASIAAAYARTPDVTSTEPNVTEPETK